MSRSLICRSGRGGRLRRIRFVSDHPGCGAKVGFADIVLMPQPPLLTKEPVQVIRVGKMGENFSSHIWPTNDDRNTAKAFRSPEKRRHWRFLDYLDSLLTKEGIRLPHHSVSSKAFAR